jgi:hypothetical protein
MYLYEFVMQNREIFKLIYTLIIGFICFLIVLKTDKLFKLSFHQGIRYFRNAFFFYGLAFIMRYVLGLVGYAAGLADYSSIVKAVFEFFLIMAGFSLVYSLLWKKFESPKGSFSSLFNPRFLIFYIMAIIVASLDYLWTTYSFMFLLQIILFAYASSLSYYNYTESKKGWFLKFYFIAIVLNLIAWIANFLVAEFFGWNKGGVIGVYILNIIIFFLFLYGVVKVTNKNNKL